MVDLAGIRTGIATCYDIRFRTRPGPGGTRRRTDRGARHLGGRSFKEKHWVTLVRARAIENTVWVAGAGRFPSPIPHPPARLPVWPQHAGRSDGDRPGRPGAMAARAMAELSRTMIAQVRAVLPCLEHRRDDVFGPAIPAGATAPARKAGQVSGSAPATGRDAARSR